LTYYRLRGLTQEEGHKLFVEDVAVAESAVDRLLHIPPQQHEFDALVSLVFNIGVKAFGNSTMLRLLNKSDPRASAQFDVWVHSDGKVLKGLVRRRAVERALYERAEYAR
jgi:lysozyme